MKILDQQPILQLQVQTRLELTLFYYVNHVVVMLTNIFSAKFP